MEPLVLISSLMSLKIKITANGSYSPLIIFYSLFHVYTYKYSYIYTLICALKNGYPLKGRNKIYICAPLPQVILNDHDFYSFLVTQIVITDLVSLSFVHCLTFLAASLLFLLRECAAHIIKLFYNKIPF